MRFRAAALGLSCSNPDRHSRNPSLPWLSTSAPARRVDSWTTVDVNIGYRVDGGSGWLVNTQSNLGINNALDQRPPSSTSLTCLRAPWGTTRPMPVCWADKSACRL
jgi:outer membrane receptor protein involved in Fe transport